MVHVKNSIAVFVPVASQCVGAYELVGSTLVVGSTVVKAAVNCLQGIYHRKNETKLNDLQREWVVLKKDFNQAIYDIAMAILAITSILGAVRYYVSNKNEKNEAEIATAILNGKFLATQKKGIESIAEFQRASKLGSVEGDLELGFALIYFDKEVRDIKRGLELLTKAAEKGNAEAQFRLGNYFSEQAEEDAKAGRSKERDENLRLKMHWLKQAAFQGHGDAQLNLSAAYDLEGPYYNFELALYWAKLSSDKNDAAKVNYAALLFEKSKDDVQKAEKWQAEGRKFLIAAADNGDDVAMYNVGRYIENNKYGFKEGPTDSEKARHWYAKAAAKENQDAIDAIARLDAADLEQQQQQAQAAAAAAAQSGNGGSTPAPMGRIATLSRMLGRALGQ